MGRTARYKKIKSCDPYSKKNGGKVSLGTVGIWGLSDNGAKPKKRSRTAERMRQEKINRRLKRQKHAPIDPSAFKRAGNGLDRPPSDTEDDFDMADLQGSLSQQKPAFQDLDEKNTSSLLTLKSSKPTNHDSNGDDDDDDTFKPPEKDIIDRKEMREARDLLSKSSAAVNDAGNKKGAAKTADRLANESKNAYNKRVKAETRQIIKQQKARDLNPEKRLRKKEFLKAKKQKKKGKGSQAAAGNSNNFSNRYDHQYDSDDDRRRQSAEDTPHFTVQAERPPTFHSLPRGASAKKKVTSNHKMSTDKDVQREQANLEKMRQQVQAQYAIIKAKRKRDGDFHL